jgi:hypothetical protein
VDGAPYFPLGGQVHNSSAYTPASMAPLWETLVRMGANTAEVPVYWEQVEPDEGRFDFGMVDALLEGAGKHDLRLVLLWFATWKNGAMSYAPAWVKRQPERYWRVLGVDGRPAPALSPHCEAARAADERAYRALLEHLREADSDHRVIAVQIENEPGSLGAARDHRPEAEELFRAPVPPEVATLLEGAPDGLNHALRRSWEAAGGRRTGAWREVFGADADELFSAYHVATYIESIAAAGKAVYPLPTVVNVWLGEIAWRRPGVDYPSGGAVARTLDVWKAVAPHVDVIAPDIYSGGLAPDPSLAAAGVFRQQCATYARPDNPLFIPECQLGPSTAFDLFRAVAEYGAIGIAPFGIDDCFDPSTGEPTSETRALVESYGVVGSMLPLVLEHLGTGRLHALVQEEGVRYLHLPLEGAVALVRFEAEPTAPQAERGRGLLVQVGPKEYYVGGVGLRVHIHGGDAPYQEGPFGSWSTPCVLVEEGRFEGTGWVSDTRLNGDEIIFVGLRPRRPDRVVHAVLE